MQKIPFPENEIIRGELKKWHKITFTLDGPHAEEKVTLILSCIELEYRRRKYHDGQAKKDMAKYFYDHDPYKHNIVAHTYPGEQTKIYRPLLGNAS